MVCKAEALQRTGSFKFRGAYNAVAALGQASRQRGVLGASSGNHAQALALAGQLLAAPVTVVVPGDAPGIKVNGAAILGAQIVTLRPLRRMTAMRWPARSPPSTATPSCHRPMTGS